MLSCVSTFIENPVHWSCAHALFVCPPYRESCTLELCTCTRCVSTLWRIQYTGAVHMLSLCAHLIENPGHWSCAHALLCVHLYRESRTLELCTRDGHSYKVTHIECLSTAPVSRILYKVDTQREHVHSSSVLDSP